MTNAYQQEVTKYIGRKDFPKAIWSDIILGPENISSRREQISNVTVGEMARQNLLDCFPRYGDYG